jgi:hypothetical protein
MAINLADNNPRIVYSVAEGVTQTVFSVPFEFFEDADVKVYVDGIEKVEGTDYTLTGGEGATGTLTFVTAEPGETQQVTGATGGSTVVLFRRIAIERTSDFQVGQDINRTALNEQLDVLTALVADMNDKWDRAVHLEEFDTGQVNFVLPPKEQRIGNYFAFDANGDPVMTSGTTSTLIVSSFAETLLDDDTAVDMLATLGITAPVADINNITGVTASATELNVLDGVTGKTGADNVLVTGTAGTDGQLAQWNTDGDVVGVSILDEDDMASDSSTQVPSQQSVKAYVDAEVSANGITQTTGSPPYFGCRAWVNFAANGTIRGSGNVASITKLATGHWRVNFTTAMPDTNYAVSVTAGGSSGSAVGVVGTHTTQTGLNTAYVDVQARFLTQSNNDKVDSDMMVMVFR